MNILVTGGAGYIGSHTVVELALVNLAVFLLIFSVFLPYRPEQEPVTAFLHLALAFSATVLFFFA